MKFGQTSRERNIRSLIGFELFMKAACLSFSMFLWKGLVEFCLWAAGYSYVTKENLVSFLLSPCVLVCVVLLVAIASFLSAFEANAVCVTVQQGNYGVYLSVSELFLETVEETRRLFKKGRKGIKIAVGCLLFVVIVNLPLVLFMLFGFVKTRDASDTAWIIGLFLVMLGAVGIAGLVCSKKRSILHGVLKRGLILFVTEGMGYFLGLLLGVFVIVHTTDSALSGIILLRMLEKYHLVCGLLFFSVNTVVFECFCADFLLREDGRGKKEKIQIPRVSQHTVRSKVCFWVICTAALVMMGVQSVAYVRNQRVFLAETLNEICITAHRGASDGAPENTMASVALAIEEGADYAEIDVRLTADGVPVLLHDNALFRTTGVLKDVDNVSYEELSAYDAGSSYSKAFAGEKVPRLADVLAEYGGKIGFNIELKTKNDRELVRAVVTLIEEYRLEESCVITSASYQQLEWVKAVNRSIKTGYILSMVYGDFYKSVAADFFSIRSGYVTESVVKRAHAVGKEVHAWTVNKENELERMKAIGVDNIITDKPAYAREIVQSNHSAETFGEWMLLFTSEK